MNEDNEKIKPKGSDEEEKFDKTMSIETIKVNSLRERRLETLKSLYSE